MAHKKDLPKKSGTTRGTKTPTKESDSSTSTKSQKSQTSSGKKSKDGSKKGTVSLSHLAKRGKHSSSASSTQSTQKKRTPKPEDVGAQSKEFESTFRDYKEDPLKKFRATDDPDQFKLLVKLQYILTQAGSAHRVVPGLPVLREVERMEKLRLAHQAQADLLETVVAKARRSKLYKRLLAEENDPDEYKFT